MTPLLKLLLGASEPGLSPIDHVSATSERLIASFGRSILTIQTGHSSTKAEMLTQFADDLQLPDWFGHNLDAAHEALHDRLAAEPTLLLTVQRPPASADTNAARQFVDLINSVLVDHKQPGLLVGPTNSVNLLAGSDSA